MAKITAPPSVVGEALPDAPQLKSKPFPGTGKYFRLAAGATDAPELCTEGTKEYRLALALMDGKMVLVWHMVKE